MSDKTRTHRNHPNAPCNQPFQMKGNKTAKKGWWKSRPQARRSPRTSAPSNISTLEDQLKAIVTVLDAR